MTFGPRAQCKYNEVSNKSHSNGTDSKTATLPYPVHSSKTPNNARTYARTHACRRVTVILQKYNENNSQTMKGSMPDKPSAVEGKFAAPGPAAAAAALSKSWSTDAS